MDVNFVESNPIPVKAAMALMGLLRAGVAAAAGAAVSRRSQREDQDAVLEAMGSWLDKRLMLRTEIEKLFDCEARANYARLSISRCSAEFKAALNAGEVSRGGAGRGRGDRLARERVGEEGHSARLPHGADRRHVDRRAQRSRGSTRPRIRCKTGQRRRAACASCRADRAFATAAMSAAGVTCMPPMYINVGRVCGRGHDGGSRTRWSEAARRSARTATSRRRRRSAACWNRWARCR